MTLLTHLPSISFSSLPSVPPSAPTSLVHLISPFPPFRPSISLFPPFRPSYFSLSSLPPSSNQLCINTAIVYMHRFYTVHSFRSFNRAVSWCTHKRMSLSLIPTLPIFYTHTTLTLHSPSHTHHSPGHTHTTLTHHAPTHTTLTLHSPAHTHTQMYMHT